MVLYGFTGGTSAVASQVDSNFNSVLTSCGLNLIRMLQDRSVDFSAGGFDWFADAYVDATGQEDSISATDTNSVFDYINLKYIASPGENSNGYAYTTSTSGYPLIRTISTIGENITKVTCFAYHSDDGSSDERFKITFNYSDATSYTSSDNAVDSYTPVIFTVTPDNTSKEVTSIEIYAETGNADRTYVGNYAIYYNNTDDVIVTQDIPAGTFGSTVSSAIGVPLIEDYETGCDIQYKITGTSGTEDSGWLDYNEISSFTAFTDEPDTLIVKLIPKSSSPTAGYPSIKGFALKAE